MFSIRRWLYKPKRSDSSLLAQFYYADEELNMVAVELDSFDGRKDPERCTSLVNQLRICQDKVLNIVQRMIDEVFEGQRASRDFRVKFPDDVLQESLAGQLWFGAECLAAGSSIMNRETESLSMRPLARALTKNLDSLRSILRERCLRNINTYSDRIKEALLIFDKLFAEFELSYVSAMVPVKTMKEYDVMQEVTVLFSESIQRALRLGLLSQEMVDDCDPALMFTIPRLAIVCGLLVYPEGPLNPDQDPSSMSEMFRPFQRLLYKIRELLYSMNSEELYTLEKAMCSTEEPFSRPGSAPPLCKQAGKLGKDSKSLDRLSLHHYYIETAGQNTVEGSILFHPPNSGSPVTPISEDEIFHVGHMSHSPSTITVIENPSESFEGSGSLHRIASDTEYLLNKCNRKDSGMLSETVESGENVNRSSSQPVNSVYETEEERLLERETTGATSHLQQYDWCCHDDDADSDCSDSYHYCSYVVNSLVDAAVTVSINRMNITKRPAPLSRQPSWQYDVQFEIPRISVDRASATEAEADGSSDRTEATSIHPELDVFMCQDDADLPETGNVDISNNATQSASTDCDKLMKHTSVANRSSSSSQSKLKFSDDKQKKVSKVVEHSLSDKSGACQRSKAGSPGLSGGQFDRYRSKSSAAYAEPDGLVSECLDVRRIQRLRYTESLSSTCSSCKSGCCPGTECEWERASSESSETSSYNSEGHDDDEIALAIQAAEIASRNEARSRFTSSGDLIHRLFVCISGVADQLQTNYASDLRNILKSVFDMNCSELPVAMENEVDRADETGQLDTRSHERNPSPDSREDNPVPPVWVADEVCAYCTSCRTPFTLVRRRHHCRNCGKIFCSRCSSNAVPLPHYGHSKPVRVCIRCFMFHVTPFTVDE